MAEKKSTKEGHESTWGANERVKADWEAANGDKVRKQVAKENEGGDENA